MSATESPDELLSRLAAEREAAAPATPHVPIAITGSRGREPSEEEMAAFFALFSRLGGTELHDGDCRGTDRAVRAWMQRHHPEIPTRPWPVLSVDGDWPAAGPRRNRRMLVQSSARHLLHFPGGKGTGSCISIAKELGRPTHSVAAEVDRRRLAIERDHLDLGLDTAGML